MIVLEESPWYNEILRRGEVRGREEGCRLQSIDRLLRLLPRMLGPIDPSQQDQIRSLSLEKLETLSESLLDFATVEDLDNWLMQDG